MTAIKQKKPVIAVTGGIGSGKSTAAKIFKRAGALTLDADAIAKDLLWNDNTVHEKVVTEFGPKICDENGIIHKKLLIPIVFANQQSIDRLNKIIHPEVIKFIDDRIHEAQEDDRLRMIVVDAALIYEAELDSYFDCVVSVIAEKQKRIDRIVSRDNVTQDSVEQRMNVQVDNHVHLKNSHYVIENSGSFNELYQQTKKIIEDIERKYELPARERISGKNLHNINY